MDRRERSGDVGEALIAYGEGLQSGIWTALPGIVQSFDAGKQTAVVQPAIQAQRLLADGTTEWVTLPLLLDCPVQFPRGGGMVFTFPIVKDDECLVIFSSRCIDAWWQSGGVQVQAELRMHDLSDGFCLPGPASVPNVPANISTTLAELRNVARTVRISVHPTAKTVDVVSDTGNVSVATGGNVNLTGAQININGVLNINGEAYNAHRHTGVAVGAGITGGKA